MKHIFDRYFTKHGHYPRVVVASGIQRITVEFAPGYVTLQASSPYPSCVYIERRALLTLLSKVLPLARTMKAHPHPDHDVPAAMREAYFQEKAILEEKRALKKQHRFDLEAEQGRQKQRQRFLRARERAAHRDGTSGDAK